MKIKEKSDGNFKITLTPYEMKVLAAMTGSGGPGADENSWDILFHKEKGAYDAAFGYNVFDEIADAIRAEVI